MVLSSRISELLAMEIAGWIRATLAYHLLDGSEADWR